MAYLSHDLKIKNYETVISPTEEQFIPQKIKNVTLTECTNIIKEIKKHSFDIDNFDRINIYYPEDYKISFDDYNNLKPLLKNKISVMRNREC